MKLDDVVKNIPLLAVHAVCIAYDDGHADARVVWANDAFFRMFAADKERAIGSNPFDLFHSDYVADVLFALEEMKESGGTNFSQDTLCLRFDGSSFWGAMSYVMIPDDNGDGRHTITYVKDIDNLKNREQSAELALIEREYLLEKVEAAQTRLMAAINMSPDPFGIFDVRNRLVIWNPAYAENATDDPNELKTGMKAGDILAMTIKNGFFDDAQGCEDEFLESQMDLWNRGQNYNTMMRIRGRDYQVMRSRVPNGDHVVLRVDVSEHLRQRRELEQYAERLEKANFEIRELALHDELTGLGNRRFLTTKLEETIAARTRTGQEIAALHIDLDYFKAVNDTLGHAAGDHVLKTVADILRDNLRGHDIVARVGGDEFVILVLCTAETDLPNRLAARLIKEISVPIPFEGRTCQLGASVGIARTPLVDASELLSCSDIALYKAKTSGRSRAAEFASDDLKKLKASRSLGSDIQPGLDRGEFHPIYQPQIDAQTGEVVAVEVSACWRHPKRGTLTEADYIDVAAELRLDGAIEQCIFEAALNACGAFFADWAAPPLLAFNVNQGRLMGQSLLDEIQGAAPSNRIVFEIDESAILGEEAATLAERLSELRKLGVMIEVDGFGSGLASLTGLKRSRPDRLKLAPHLTEPVATSESARRLVRSIVEIGRSFDIGVTAGGVATGEQAEELRKLGCDRLQGTYFGSPGTLEEIFASAAASAPPGARRVTS